MVHEQQRPEGLMLLHTVTVTMQSPKAGNDGAVLGPRKPAIVLPATQPQAGSEARGCSSRPVHGQTAC